MVSDETRKIWNEKYRDIEEAVSIGKIELNEWEDAFIDSISIDLACEKDISMRQSICLNKIWERAI
ncbi:MAG TPA: hypothetical protein VMW95_03565 [Desulfobacterales bacterium]|nr:hypothetical protein [Desulfobacterales bacterium]